MLGYSEAFLDSKPYKEIYDGKLHRKVSPKTAHSLVQGKLMRLIDDWGSERGPVGPEWRFRLDEGTTLVPDVAFIAQERFDGLEGEDREMPPFAPDLAVEVRSPRDRKANVARKTELYLMRGATVVLNVDPKRRTILMSTRDGERTYVEGDVLTHAAFPGLSIRVSDVFAPLDRLKKGTPSRGS